MRGTTFGAPCAAEVELAERVVASYPAAEQVRFVSSGTEAVMSAIRLARAFTSRDLIVKFAGCYHGHADHLLVAAGSGLATFGQPSSAGVPAGVHRLHARAAARRRGGAGGAVRRRRAARCGGHHRARAGQSRAAAAAARVPYAAARADARARRAADLRRGDLGFPSGARRRRRSARHRSRSRHVRQGDRRRHAGRRLRRRARRHGAPRSRRRYLPGGHAVRESGRHGRGRGDARPAGARVRLATPGDARRGTRAARETGARGGAISRSTWCAPGRCSGCRCTSAGAPRTAAALTQQEAARFAALFHAMLERGVYLPPSAYETCFLSLAHSGADLARFTQALRESLATVASDP